MIGRVPGFVALASLSMGSAHAEVRRPTGAWTVAPTGNECLLTRPYGNSKEPLFLAVSQTPMSSSLDIMVLRSSKNTDLKRAKGRIILGGVELADLTYDALLLAVSPKTGLKAKTMRRIWIGIPGSAYDAAKAAKTIRLDAPKEINEEFAVPGFAEALQRLEDCTIRLAETWGYPANEQRRIAKQAVPIDSLDTLFKAQDYPPSALREGVMGRVRVKVPVNASGEPAGCDVVAASGNSDLDSTTCNIILSRARFEPATDVDGKPVRSVFVETIQWLLM